MCTISMIGDGYRDQFPTRWPDVTISPPSVPRHEFDALKKEVQELRALLMAAKKFDEETGQPNCEIDEKVELIKKIADLVGVDMTEVFNA